MFCSFFHRHKITLIIIMCVVCALLLGAGGYGYYYLTHIRRLPKNLTISGIPLGGLTQAEATHKLETDFNQRYDTADLQITAGNCTVVLSRSISNVSIKARSAVWAAFSADKDTKVFDAIKYITFDKDAVQTIIQHMADDLRASLVPTTFSVTGELPDLTAAEVADGALSLVVKKGIPKYLLNTSALMRAIVNSYNTGNSSIHFPVRLEVPDAPNWDSISAEYCTTPVSAEMDMTTFEVSDHKFGYSFSIEDAKAKYAETDFGAELTVPFSAVAPGQTKQALQALLYRDVLGSYTAYSSSQYNRDINLKLSCQAINGTVLFPGEVFRYNATLGERTPEKGYKPAAGYMGKEVVDSYGGGICQASSALYYSAMIADLEIVERHNHGYASAYMPLGMDATVDWAGPDFKFKNTTQYPVRIEAYAYGGTVTVRLLGTDTKDHYVKMQYEVLSVDNYETIYVEMEENNPKGYKDGQVITTPYTGYKVRTYRCKYDKATNALLSKNLEASSTYWKRDKEICKIIDLTTP